MVTATVRVKIPAEWLSQAITIFARTSERTRVEPGCLSCRMYQDLQEEQVIALEEVWNEEEDLEQYLRSQIFRDVLLVLEMASRPPEIEFRNISRVSGLEKIEEARRGLM
jgi:quinol monooxygenase YgiN